MLSDERVPSTQSSICPCLNKPISRKRFTHLIATEKKKGNILSHRRKNNGYAQNEPPNVLASGLGPFRRLDFFCLIAINRDRVEYLLEFSMLGLLFFTEATESINCPKKHCTHVEKTPLRDWPDSNRLLCALVRTYSRGKIAMECLASRR